MVRSPSNPVNYSVLTDKALLDLFQSDHDGQALETVVRRHHSVVSTVCRQLLGNRHDAEDAYQATFLVLVRNAAKIRKPQSLSSWLYGVASRVSVRIRQKRARSERDGTEEIAMTTADALSELAHKEQASVTHEAITALPETLRQPMVLRYVAGLSNQEVADELSLTVSAVEGRLKRAKARLRVRLARQGLILSAALATIQRSTVAARTSTESAAVQALVQSTVEYCLQSNPGGNDVLPESETISHLVNAEMNAMLLSQITRLGLFVGVCLVATGFTSIPQLTARADTEPQAGAGDERQQSAGGVSAARDSQNLFGDDTLVVQSTKQSTGVQVSRPTSIQRFGATGRPAVATSEPIVPTTTVKRFGRTTGVKDDAVHKRILAEFSKPTQVDFFDEPIGNAMAYLEQRHGIQIKFDQSRLDEEGLTTDAPITVSLKNIRLESALNLMLQDLRLSYTIRDEVLLITTNHVLETRVYTFHQDWTIPSDQLIKQIEEHVFPDSWQSVGGEGRISTLGDGAVVTQTLNAHRAIEALLGAIDARLRR